MDFDASLPDFRLASDGIDRVHAESLQTDALPFDYQQPQSSLLGRLETDATETMVKRQALTESLLRQQRKLELNRTLQFQLSERLRMIDMLLARNEVQKKGDASFPAPDAEPPLQENPEDDLREQKNSTRQLLLSFPPAGSALYFTRKRRNYPRFVTPDGKPLSHSAKTSVIYSQRWSAAQDRKLSELVLNQCSLVLPPGVPLCKDGGGEAARPAAPAPVAASSVLLGADRARGGSHHDGLLHPLAELLRPVDPHLRVDARRRRQSSAHRGEDPRKELGAGRAPAGQRPNALPVLRALRARDRDEGLQPEVDGGGGQAGAGGRESVRDEVLEEGGAADSATDVDPVQVALLPVSPARGEEGALERLRELSPPVDSPVLWDGKLDWCVEANGFSERVAVSRPLGERALPDQSEGSLVVEGGPPAAGAVRPVLSDRLEGSLQASAGSDGRRVQIAL